MTETSKQKMEKIIEEVKSIRDSLPDGILPEEIENGSIYDLVNLYAEHAVMFEMLSKRLLEIKIEKLENKTIKEILEESLKEKIGSGIEINIIKKEHLEKLKNILEELDANNENDKKTKDLINEVISLKETKKHIAVDRLRASKKQDKTNLIEVAELKDKYNGKINNFKGIPNSIQITDIHNDMYHFLLGMTEPIGNPPVAAFEIDSSNPIKKETINGVKYEYPNLKFNPEFKGTITFGGDLIQSHDSKVEDNLGAIPLCLAMKDCMEQTPYNLLSQVENLKNKLSGWKKEKSSRIDFAGTIEKNLNEIYKILNGEEVELIDKEKRASKLERLIEELRGINSKGAAGTDEKLNVKHSEELVSLISKLKEDYERVKTNIEQKINNGEKINPPIVYVAGNHEMEALNEGQHPEVRTIMQDMFKEGLVKYCYYDEANDTFISHTKLNKPLIEVIGNNVDGYDSLFNGTKPNRTLKEISTSDERKLLTKMLNENFDKHFNIDKEALFQSDPEGINDFAIVGEELERTYFRKDEKRKDEKEYNCEEAIKNFKDSFGEEEKKDKFEKLEALQEMALALSGVKGKVKIKDQEKCIKNFTGLKTWSDYPITIEVDVKKNIVFSIEKGDNDTIILKKGDAEIGKPFTFDEAGELFAQAINSNPNSRPYSLMNRGALCNYSGGLFGYENDHPEEALDLGCKHIVGHRPTILQKGFISLNVPVVETIEEHKEKSLQTDYNGKNEESYVNCRITKFDSEGKPHLVGISKMLEKHREFFAKERLDIDNDIARLCDDLYLREKNINDVEYEKKIKKFVEYFKSNPPPLNVNSEGLKNYFINVGKTCSGLKIKDEVNLDNILKRYNFIKRYQKLFDENREKILKKQNNIKEQAQKQGQARGQG